MPELLPSCLKPNDSKHLSGAAPKTDEGKAERYRAMRPGVNIPTEQAAARFDLMNYRHENGIINRRRKTRVGSITVPKSASALWDENGKMRP